MLSNLENMINKIVADVDEKIFVLENEKLDKLNNLQHNFDNKLNSEKESLTRKYEVSKNLELERIISTTELKAKSKILAKKQLLIRKTIDELKNILNNISSDELLDYILSVLKNRKEKYEDEVISIPSRYFNLKDRIDNIILDESIKNGFIIKYKGIEENYTFDSLINYKSEEIEKVIQKYFE